MGGKDGGGGGGGGYNANNFVSVETPEGVITATPEYAAAYYPNARKMGLGDFEAAGSKFPDMPVAAPAAAAPEAPAAPAPQAPAPEAPAPEAPAGPPASLGPPIDPGSPIAQPDPMGAGAIVNTGDALAGGVLKPPNYWMGGTRTSGRRGGGGSMTTTQT
jgi:hypothetical protein